MYFQNKPIINQPKFKPTKMRTNKCKPGLHSECYRIFISRKNISFFLSYGDIAPKSVIGRSITILWMVFGILIAAMVTSTMTDAVGSIEYLDIYKSNVRALFFSSIY